MFTVKKTGYFLFVFTMSQNEVNFVKQCKAQTCIEEEYFNSIPFALI